MRQPRKKRTAAQHAADIKFAKAGRSSQASKRAASIARTGHAPARSKKQVQAALKWAAAGRASQARKRQGLKPLAKKAPALSLNDEPVCAAVAIAEHLAVTMNVFASDMQVLALAMRAAGRSLEEFLEAVAEDGLAGASLARFTPCDEDVYVPGLVYGVQLRGGYHAALSHPDGMVSWGLVVPWQGVPDQAWHLEWDYPG